MSQLYKSLYPPFQKWVEKGNIKIISDPHFLDEDMEWRNIKAYEIAEKFNKGCRKGDTLIILGDVGNPSFLSIIRDGVKKVLIKGNHDAGSDNYKEYFDEIYEGPVMISEKIMLSHEPINGPWLNIHGHDHMHAGEQIERSINVCCEGIDFTPICLKDIIQNGKLKKIDSIHRETIDSATERKTEKIGNSLGDSINAKKIIH